MDADASSIPVGVDGEAVSLPTPVRCSVQPGAVRPGVHHADGCADGHFLLAVAFQGANDALRL